MRDAFHDRGSICCTGRVCPRGTFIRIVEHKLFLLPDRGVPCMEVCEDDHGAAQLAQNPIIYLNLKPIDIYVIIS